VAAWTGCSSTRRRRRRGRRRGRRSDRLVVLSLRVIIDLVISWRHKDVAAVVGACVVLGGSDVRVGCNKMYIMKGQACRSS